MDKNVIKQIILGQQEFISRVELQKRDIAFDSNVNYVLVGMRRAGKSYMLYQHIHDLLDQGHRIEEMLFVNFEDERICDITKDELHLVLEAYREMFAFEPFIFLDEIQNIDGWEHFARRLADEKRRVMITGSNAHMLSREVALKLGGRYMTKEIYPFSFREYIEYRGIRLGSHWELSPVRADVVRCLSEYLNYGGLSEMFDVSDKRSWLQSLYQKILYSDIVARNGIRNERSMKMLVRKLADSVMQPMAVKRLQNILQGDGSRISRETVGNYLDYLNESFLVFGVCSFTSAVSERTTIMKHYFYDNGILDLFLFHPETKLLENIVAIHLFKRFGSRLFYYNKNVEVDFCVPSAGLLVQVSYDISSPSTLEREITALEKTCKFLQSERIVIVTYDREDAIHRGGLTIEIVPVWRFLLE